MGRSTSQLARSATAVVRPRPATTIAAAGEACDDGGTLAGDGCDALCVLEFCGDGIVNNVTEVCYDGLNNGTSGFCASDCLAVLP